MSIFGSNPNQEASSEANNVDLSAYAKKDYVDQKDDLRVMKSGDTMRGDLNMRRRLVRGLPTDYPPRYSGDEAISWRQALNLMNDYFQLALKLDGRSTMRGALQMGNHYIKNVKDPLQPQDAATKNYVDSRGTSITGDLQMGDYQIKAMKDPTDSQDATTKSYVDRQRHKPVITVWAERKQTAKHSYEWSFGGNASRVGTRYGYKMLAPGRILRFGLEMVTHNRIPITYGKVNITVNGTRTVYAATLFDGRQPENRLSTPLELEEGDVINFTTTNTRPEVRAEIANLLIELDL